MPRALSISLPAPVGGWNARDALSDMDKLDAVSMVNWWPRTTDVMFRKGKTSFSTGMTNEVETVMVYNGATTSKMFGVAGTTIFDCSSSGPAASIGGAPATVSNARWQYVNMQTNAPAFYLLAVNGTDKLRGYTGAAWYVDGDGSHDITGLDTSTAIHINVHKFRVWFTQKNTLDAWYLATGAIAGAATKFSLEGIARSGGYLVGMGTWTIDAGYGVDDHAVFITSLGEVIVYSGTDPSSTATWSLVGVFQIGSPVGRRCFTKFAGDLLIITQDGLVPLSGALQSSRTNPRVALSDKIQNAVSEAVDSYVANFGWEIQPYPRMNMLVLNVPALVPGGQEQYVMNTITKSWARFTGWGVNSLELYNDTLYGGGTGVIYKLWDDTNDDGANISGDLQQAFSYLGKPGLLKRVTLMRPTLNTTGPVPLYAGLNIDFDLSVPTSTLQGLSSGTGGSWDTATWDVDDWAGGDIVQAYWQDATGVGYAVSPHYTLASKGMEVRLMSTDISFEAGAIL